MALTNSPYSELLQKLQSYKDANGQSYPRIAELAPPADSICDIDLNSRTIALPMDRYALTCDTTYDENKIYYKEVIENGKGTYVTFPFSAGQKISDDHMKVFERYSGFLSVQYEHNAEIIYFRCPRYFNNMDLARTVCLIEFVNAHGDGSIYWVPYYDINHYSVAPDGTDEPVIIFPWAINGLATAYEGNVEFVVRFYQLTDDYSEFAFNMSTVPIIAPVLHGMDISDLSELEILNYDATAIESICAMLSEGLEQAAIYWTEAN